MTGWYLTSVRKCLTVADSLRLPLDYDVASALLRGMTDPTSPRLLARDVLQAFDPALPLRLTEWRWAEVYDVADLYAGAKPSREEWLRLVAWMEELQRDAALEACAAGQESWDAWEADADAGLRQARRWFDAAAAQRVAA